MKAIREKKTDKKDAKWIADIFKHNLMSGSFTPPADIRQLRDLVRYRWKLNNFIVGEKKHAENHLTVSNCKLDDVFSDVFGKATTNITSYLLEHPNEPFLFKHILYLIPEKRIWQNTIRIHSGTFIKNQKHNNHI